MAAKVERVPSPSGAARLVWQPSTFSPRPARSEAKWSSCGEPDAGLARVAARLVVRAARGEPPPEPEELAFLLRVEGSPYVWPHAWTLSSAASDADVRARLARFEDGLPVRGVRRCGVSTTRAGDGATSAVAVIADAAGDLSPLPTRVREGQWLRISATTLVPADLAKVVVLGPTGAPRSIPTTLHDGHVEATFSADRPGMWSIQILLNGPAGPRPALEARLFAAMEPPAVYASIPAPGEGEGDAVAVAVTDDNARVRAMVNGARTRSGRAPLSDDPRLDRLARAHASAMQARGELGHDAGDGNPLTRLERAGVAVGRAGENVAHAESVVEAHRALWDSISHRENLLDARFDRLGVGSVRDRDGSVWICEIFGDFAEAGIEHSEP